MRREIGTPVLVAVIVVVLAIVGYFGYKMVLASPKSNISAEQQKENMRHMIKP